MNYHAEFPSNCGVRLFLLLLEICETLSPHLVHGLIRPHVYTVKAAVIYPTTSVHLNTCTSNV